MIKTIMALLCMTTLAHADDWPAVSTQVIPLANVAGQTNDGCRNRALTVLSDLSMSHLGAAGENLTYGVAAVEGRDYAVSVRCQVEHHIVFLVVAGPTLVNAHKIMGLLQSAWSPGS